MTVRAPRAFPNRGRARPALSAFGGTGSRSGDFERRGSRACDFRFGQDAGIDGPAAARLHAATRPPLGALRGVRGTGPRRRRPETVDEETRPCATAMPAPYFFPRKTT